MKRFVGRMTIVLLVCAMTSIAALADVISKDVTFSEDVKVNDTLVKKGTYKFHFDQAKGELTIANGKATVARTGARMEKREGKSLRTVIGTKGDAKELRSITFRGETQSFVVGASEQATTGAQ
jgi:hypothetical protein